MLGKAFQSLQLAWMREPSAYANKLVSIDKLIRSDIQIQFLHYKILDFRMIKKDYKGNNFIIKKIVFISISYLYIQIK